MATAAALLVFFWRDWVRIIGGFFSSIRHRRVKTDAERLAWLIVLATIPVGIAGLVLEHVFRTVLGKPMPAAAFLFANGLILFFGERLRRKATAAPAAVVTAGSGDSGAEPESLMRGVDLDEGLDDEQADLRSDARLARTQHETGRADRLRADPRPAAGNQPVRVSRWSPD